FTKQFKRKGENLMANFSYGEDREDGTEIFDQKFYNPQGQERPAFDLRNNLNSEFTRSYNAQIDYTLPFNENQKLEAGFRSSSRTDEESLISDSYDQNLGTFVRDYDLSNDFELEDIVHAFYSNYQHQ